MSNYYTPVSQRTFEEIKQAALLIWSNPNYDYHESYIAEKLLSIQIENIKDNYAHIIGQFDHGKQAALAGLLSDDAKLELYDRLQNATWGGRGICSEAYLRSPS
ncbi:MAG TPA: hypothetical protein VNG32_00410 [Candidatus Dormibacteraeota bacterium]|nr:hypothetical protein [Candidatus Dormibacteraeota bacterium]